MTDAVIFTCVSGTESPYFFGTIDGFDLTTDSELSGSPFATGTYPNGIAVSRPHHHHRPKWAAWTCAPGVGSTPGQVFIADISVPTSPDIVGYITVGDSPIGCVFDPQVARTG